MNLDFKTEFETMQQQGWRALPFGKIFTGNPELLQAFETEFSKAPLIPCIRKYTSKEFSDEDLKTDWLKNHSYSTEVENRLRELATECGLLHSQRKLNKKFYVHDITQTNIYTQLRAIGDIVNDFKQMRNYNPNPDSILQHAQQVGKSILNEASKIDFQPLRKIIVDEMLNDKENILFGRWTSDQKADYEKAKMYLNNFLLSSKQKVKSYSNKKETQLQSPELELPERFNEIKDKFYSDNDNSPSKIQIASFIELLCTKNYFGKDAKQKRGKNPVPVWKSIAVGYFDIVIIAELESSKKGDRKKHIQLLEKYFK